MDYDQDEILLDRELAKRVYSNLNFLGKGFPSKYINHMTEVTWKSQSDDDVLVTHGWDDEGDRWVYLTHNGWTVCVGDCGVTL